MTDPAAAATAANAIPWGNVVLWVLSAIGGTATVLVTAFGAIWLAYTKKDKALTDSLTARTSSAETRAANAEEAKRTAEDCYVKLNREFKATVEALGTAVRRSEARVHGVALSVPPPKADGDDPTIRFYINADKYRDAVSRLEQEERDRERSVGNQVYLRQPRVPQELALEGVLPMATKGRLPAGAGREDYRAHERDQREHGITTPEQPVNPHNRKR